MAKRLKLDLLISEVADLLGIDQSVVRDIEQVSELRSASLKDYLRYADTLSCSLLEIFDADPSQEPLIPLSQVFKQVEAAIQQLEKQGKLLTRRNISNLVGMEATRLWDYPRMVSLLTKRPQSQIPRSQAEKIEHELEQLAESLSPLDLQKVVQDDVEQAQALGTSLTYWSISERVGISKGILRSNSQVRAIVDRAQNEARQRRENELVNRVEQAIEELVSQGKKVTVSKVSQIVDMDHKGLDRRPQIKELFLVLR